MNSIFGSPDLARLVARQTISERVDTTRREGRARRALRGRRTAA